MPGAEAREPVADCSHQETARRLREQLDELTSAKNDAEVEWRHDFGQGRKFTGWWSVSLDKWQLEYQYWCRDTAAEGLALGLFAEVVPDARCLPIAADLAARIAAAEASTAILPVGLAFAVLALAVFAYARLGDAEASRRHLELYQRTSRELEERLVEVHVTRSQLPAIEIFSGSSFEELDLGNVVLDNSVYLPLVLKLH